MSSEQQNSLPSDGYLTKMVTDGTIKLIDNLADDKPEPARTIFKEAAHKVIGPCVSTVVNPIEHNFTNMFWYAKVGIGCLLLAIICIVWWFSSDSSLPLWTMFICGAVAVICGIMYLITSAKNAKDTATAGYSALKCIETQVVENGADIGMNALGTMMQSDAQPSPIVQSLPMQAPETYQGGYSSHDPHYRGGSYGYHGGFDFSKFTDKAKNMAANVDKNLNKLNNVYNQGLTMANRYFSY
jgi:hypothetical protein